MRRTSPDFKSQLIKSQKFYYRSRFVRCFVLPIFPFQKLEYQINTVIKNFCAKKKYKTKLHHLSIKVN